MPDNVENLVTAAIRSPEEDVSPPSRVRTTSMTALLCELPIGETASRVMAVDPNLPLAEVATCLPKMRDALRNSLASAVQRAKAKTGGEFSIEVDDHFTGKGRLFILALITRFA